MKSNNNGPGAITSKSSLDSLLDTEIRLKIDEVLEKRGEIITKQEMKEIIQEIIPELHQMTAFIVKQHFNALAQYILNNI
jgi:cell division ATPase FtsA